MSWPHVNTCTRIHIYSLCRYRWPNDHRRGDPGGPMTIQGRVSLPIVGTQTWAQRHTHTNTVGDVSIYSLPMFARLLCAMCYARGGAPVC